MYFIKRAFKYLKNKMGRTILLGVIFLVIANFVLAGLLVQNASEQAQTNTRNSIGSDINYAIDWQGIYEDVAKGVFDRKEAAVFKTMVSSGIVYNENFEAQGAPTYKNIMIAVDSDYVESYDISLSFSLSGDGLSSYVLDTQQANSGTTFQAKTFVVEVPSDFTDEESVLLEGRYASAAEIENGANVVMIEENVADINNIGLGDIITLEASLLEHEQQEVEYEIIGIYETSAEVDARGSNLPQNVLYVPYNTISSFGLTDDELNNLVATPNVIKLSDPENTDAFLMEVESKVNLVYGSLTTNDALYESIIGPIKSLGEISSILVVIIAAAGALIIGLITALTVNERKEEIGILLAVGEKKLKIVSQFIIEVIAIALIAFVLSTFTGTYIGNRLSEGILESDILQTQEVQVENTRVGQIGQSATGSKSGNVTSGTKNFSNTKEVEQAEVDISLSLSVLLQLFGLGLLLSAVSTMLPALYVMRFNPKQILTNKSS